MSRFLNVLRSWLVMVSVIAMGNTVQSFRDHSFLSEKLYTGTPEFVNGLQARTFGIWTLLSSIIRCACAIDIHNRTLYHITLWTFVLALGHFLSEAFIYKTAPLTIGVMAPLIVASKFLCHRNAHRLPVFSRDARRSWRAAEETQLKSYQQLFLVFVLC
uniref:Ergosterol biosynthesis 28 homolog n=1 Tax=Anabas testudineus TaxID=64144 RepID=A0A7N6AG37_ANATE